MFTLLFKPKTLPVTIPFKYVVGFVGLPNKKLPHCHNWGWINQKARCVCLWGREGSEKRPVALLKFSLAISAVGFKFWHWKSVPFEICLNNAGTCTSMTWALCIYEDNYLSLTSCLKEFLKWLKILLKEVRFWKKHQICDSCRMHVKCFSESTWIFLNDWFHKHLSKMISVILKTLTNEP